MIIRDQIPERRPQVIAKAAALRVGAAKITADESEAELLRQVAGRIGVAQGTQEIAVYGPAVASQQILAGGTGLLGWCFVDLLEHRPERRDPAQAVSCGSRLHPLLLFA